MRDITGQRFGRLTALRRTDEKKGTTYVWECRCDCGNTHLSSLHNLTAGNTKSCGCLRSEHMAAVGQRYGVVHGRQSAKDMLGQRFGRLIVTEKTDLRNENNIVWKCLCDCGKSCYVSGYNLRQGYTQSCGCLRVEAGLRNVPLMRENRTLVDGTDVRMLAEMALRTDNKTKIRGVSWDKTRNCYRATIVFKGKQYYLGRFGDIEEARKARAVAEERVFGGFLEWYAATMSAGVGYR